MNIATEIAEFALCEQPACARCGVPFELRKTSGGKPQKYCSETCRRKADAERKANAPQRAQREDAEPALVEPTPLAPEVAPPAEPTYWRINRQYEIEVRTCTDGTVEIEQESQHTGIGDDDTDTIIVNRENAVALARRILWAAGFDRIGIYTYANGGGCDDLSDGDTADEVSS